MRERSRGNERRPACGSVAAGRGASAGVASSSRLRAAVSRAAGSCSQAEADAHGQRGPRRTPRPVSRASPLFLSTRARAAQRELPATGAHTISWAGGKGWFEVRGHFTAAKVTRPRATTPGRAGAVGWARAGQESGSCGTYFGGWRLDAFVRLDLCKSPQTVDIAVTTPATRHRLT